MQQTFTEFAKANGDGTGRDWVYKNGRYLFPSGAMLSEDGHQKWSPPVDPSENRSQRRYFLVSKLDYEISQWDAFKAKCMEQAQHAKSAPHQCPPPSARAVEQLERGKERIAKLREALADLEAEQRGDPNSALAIQEARDAKLREKFSEVDQIVSEIAAIEI